MDNNVKNIKFDRNKYPGVDVEIMPLEQILKRNDLDHSPKDLHRVEFYILMIITAGSGVHTIDFTDFEYSKGSVITIRKNQLHKFHNSTATGFMLLFTEEFMLSYLEKGGAQKIMQLFNELFYSQKTDLNSIELTKFITLIQEIEGEFHQPIDEHTSGIIRNLLQILVSRLHRLRVTASPAPKDQKYVPQFLRFQEMVEKCWAESRAVQDYANRLSVTTKTLNNIVHHITNKSTKTFIDEVAILHIKRLLINSSLNVKEIAYQSGFEEPSNLFKFFKRYTGQTPEHFRAAYSQAI